MNDVIIKEREIEKVDNLIYEVRGVQVMMGFALAQLYECTNRFKMSIKQLIEILNVFLKVFIFN